MVKLECDINEIVGCAKQELHFYPDYQVSDLGQGNNKWDAVLLKAARAQKEYPDGRIELNVQLSIWCPYINTCTNWKELKAKHKEYIYEKKRILSRIIWLLTKPKPFKFKYSLLGNNASVDYQMVNHPVTENCVFGVVASLVLVRWKTAEEREKECCDGLYFDTDQLKTGRFSKSFQDAKLSE